jgi:hypothetical protein
MLLSGDENDGNKPYGAHEQNHGTIKGCGD